MFLTLISAILTRVKKCFHIGLCVGGIITLASCTHVLLSFILRKLGYGMSPGPFLACSGMGLARETIHLYVAINKTRYFIISIRQIINPVLWCGTTHLPYHSNLLLLQARPKFLNQCSQIMTRTPHTNLPFIHELFDVLLILEVFMSLELVSDITNPKPFKVLR